MESKERLAGNRIKEGGLSWKDKAEAFLAAYACPCNTYGDQEALVYFLSRPGTDTVDRTQAIEQVRARWEHDADETYKEFVKQEEEADRTPGGTGGGKGSASWKAVDLSRPPCCYAHNFWTAENAGPFTIDATMLRTAEWAEISGFDNWWRKLAREIRQDVSGGALGSLLSAPLFALCRSDYALRLLAGEVPALAWAMLRDGWFFDGPWTTPPDASGCRESVAIPAAIVFAGKRSPEASVDSAMVGRAVDFLRDSQQATGAWPRWAGDQDGSIEMTAMAVHALVLAQPTGWQQAVRSAGDWLLNQQMPDGAWSESAAPHPVWLTVLVLDAIELASGGTQLTFTLPDEDSSGDKGDEPKPKAWEKLELKEGPGGAIAILYGREYRLTGKNDLPFLKMLQEEQGTPIKADFLECTLGERASRIFDRLAPPLQAIVDRPGRGQSGYRMI